MLDELSKYKSKGHFFFTKEIELEAVCNAPDTGLGVYVVYMLKNGKIELVYIGSSGKVLQNGQLKTRIGGIAERIIHGKQFGAARSESWKAKLIDENIDALDVYWYETFDKENNDIPCAVKSIIIQNYYHINGELPKWNKEH